MRAEQRLLDNGGKRVHRASGSHNTDNLIVLIDRSRVQNDIFVGQTIVHNVGQSQRTVHGCFDDWLIGHIDIGIDRTVDINHGCPIVSIDIAHTNEGIAVVFSFQTLDDALFIQCIIKKRRDALNGQQIALDLLFNRRPALVGNLSEILPRLLKHDVIEQCEQNNCGDHEEPYDTGHNKGHVSDFSLRIFYEL